MKEVEFWTDKLLSIGEIDSTMIGEGEGSFREFNLENGTAFGWTLFATEEVHCFRAFLSRGTVFPLHEHNLSAETTILYRGAMQLICSEEGCKPESTTMEIGKPVYLDKRVNHKLVALEDSWVISVLIPPDKELNP